MAKADSKQTANSVKPRQAAPKKRQYLRAEERRKTILEAAREVFSGVGLQGARTRELAQAAGINQATLFEHFKSKEELFVAAVMEPLEALMEGSRQRAESYAEAESSDTLSTRVQLGMQEQLQSVIDNFPLLAQALFSDRELGEQLYRDHIRPMLQARADIMSMYIKKHLEPDLVQLASFGMLFAIAMEQYMTGEQQDLAEVSRQLTELTMYGATRT